jgi:ATP-dependent helicase HrpB
LKDLPIDPLLPEIVRAVGEAGALVVEAPPGAGKTTRVPAALLDSGIGGEIVVLEPRRLAARLAARRVASERGERIGESIGYSVRFEDVSSARTRVRYATEGVLLRRLVEDPRLDGVGAVVLDEFHERHLVTDLALTLVETLRRSARPDLKLVVMSATLDAAPVAAYLGGCPSVRSQGRMFEVMIEHLDRPDDRPLDKQVVSAVRTLLREGPQGDVLVFLPGAGEIRRASEALDALAREHGALVLPLHGDLPLAEQARAVEPAARPKIVLATNVAESSVTIDGVTGVVDSGLARIATHSPWTGLARLSVEKISRASATQRAGRAGRTRDGRVLRLYTRGDFESRRDHDAPELLRLDLTEALLELHGAGVRDPGSLAWLDSPPPAALDAAEALLRMLGALDAGGGLTPLGRRLLAFPVHPRLARLIVEAERRGVAEEGCLFAALLGERDIRRSARVSTDRGPPRQRFQPHAASGSSDLLELVERFDEAEAAGFEPHRLRSLELDARTAQAVDRAGRQLARIARDQAPRPDSLEQVERALGIAVLAGFPDRVAKRRRRGARELVLSSGASAELGESSVVHEAPLLVAVDVEERAHAGRSSAAIVRIASAIDGEWLLDLYPDLLEHGEELVFNADSGRVELVSRIACGSVVLDESRAPARPSPESARLLARAAQTTSLAGAARGSLDALVARVELVRTHAPELELPELGDVSLERALETAAEGKVALAELDVSNLAELVLARLSPRQAQTLRQHAPERVTLPGGRSLEVHYERDKAPWIESRLQDFFGMADGPRVCAGRVALTLHLLAPNQRAVQVTSDLAGFWQRHYPGIRKELMRRYPRHPWPEDGRHATPPAPRPRR